MFLRRKKNKRGTSSIQIIDKSSGHYRVVKTIGSSSDEETLGALWRKGQDVLEHLTGQLRLDMLSAGDQTILSFFNQTDSIKVRVVGPEQILGSIFNSIGYNAKWVELKGPSSNAHPVSNFDLGKHRTALPTKIIHSPTSPTAAADLSSRH